MILFCGNSFRTRIRDKNGDNSFCCGYHFTGKSEILPLPIIINGFNEGLGEFITGRRDMREKIKRKNFEEV